MNTELIDTKDTDLALVDLIIAILSLQEVIDLFCYMFPEFIEHEGNVYLEDHFNENVYNQWKLQLKDKADIQKVVNHIHIEDLVTNIEQLGTANLLFIAETLVSCWKLKLSKDYPEHEFNFICEQHLVEDSSTTTISFYE